MTSVDNEQGCRNSVGGGGGGCTPLQSLADQLTLFQSGGQIMPTTLVLAPPPEFDNLRHSRMSSNEYFFTFRHHHNDQTAEY